MINSDKEFDQYITDKLQQELNSIGITNQRRSSLIARLNAAETRPRENHTHLRRLKQYLLNLWEGSFELPLGKCLIGTGAFCLILTLCIGHFFAIDLTAALYLLNNTGGKTVTFVLTGGISSL